MQFASIKIRVCMKNLRKALFWLTSRWSAKKTKTLQKRTSWEKAYINPWRVQGPKALDGLGLGGG